MRGECVNDNILDCGGVGFVCVCLHYIRIWVFLLLWDGGFIVPRKLNNRPANIHQNRTSSTKIISADCMVCQVPQRLAGNGVCMRLPSVLFDRLMDFGRSHKNIILIL